MKYNLQFSYDKNHENLSHSPSEKKVKNLPSTKQQQQHDLSCFFFDEVALVKFMVPSYTSRPSNAAILDKQNIKDATWKLAGKENTIRMSKTAGRNRMRKIREDRVRNMGGIKLKQSTYQ